MKKFEFNLEKLLTYKDQVLDSELMTLAVLNSQLLDAKQKLSAQQTEMEQCRAEFDIKIQEQTTPAACRMYIFYTEHLKEKITQTKKEIAVISGQIEKQADLIKKLKLETKSLETLKTARFDEYRKENLKAEERQIDEFVSTAKLLKKTV
ncbi:MAG: flagellar export protein FliJ [Eubacteriales bacterium]|nr:flagellar export protein FliJ [Eubacteriales bacterium]MDD3199251.1 flagellar export protein FliJ [Eubacteriales bacterium]MDD4121406.1 flagellar export protein FliJ [Eubacteriales bacterium]MDD4629382.1 flagellar export protein FliJ [Eubacteriales bacterium]